MTQVTSLLPASAIAPQDQPATLVTKRAGTGLWQRTAILYFIYIIQLAILFWPATSHLLHVWVNSATHHHGAFALPIALWLIWRWRHEGPAPHYRRFPLLIPASLALGFLAMMQYGSVHGISFLQHLALAGLTFSGGVALLGIAAARYHLFALSFMFFMVPVGDVFMPPLQDITASFIVLMFSITNMEIVRNGTMLITEAGRFNVAEACAGMRFIMTAAMIAAFYGMVYIQNHRKTFLFMGIAVMVAIAINLMRAWLMVLIATLSDMRLATGVDHLYFGWVLYFLTFAIIILLGRRFMPPSRNGA